MSLGIDSIEDDLSVISGIDVDVRSVRKFRVGDVVRMREEDSRADLDGDGLYFVVGTQAGVVLKFSSVTYEPKVRLAYENGLCERKPDEVVKVSMW